MPDAAALDCADVAAAEDAAAVVDAATDEAAALDDVPCPSGCVTVDSCGKSLSSWARTAGAAASSRPNRPTDGRIVMCVRRSTGVVMRSGVSKGPLKGAAWVKGDTESCGRSCLRG